MFSGSLRESLAVRDPPPAPCSAYVLYVYSVGVGGPQGSWALWALTFYNPNSVYRYESDDTWRHTYLTLTQKPNEQCVEHAGPTCHRVVLGTN